MLKKRKRSIAGIRQSFIAASKDVERILAQGGSRDEIRKQKIPEQLAGAGGLITYRVK